MAIYTPITECGLGSDTITATTGDGMIAGGDDDDLIVSNGFNYSEGGDGNDTISGLEGEQIFGGAGDDVLSADIDTTYDGGVVLVGGMGDDTITATSAIGYSHSDFPSVNIIGGDGADTIDLQLNLSDGFLSDTPSQFPTSATTAIGLGNFDADEDSLVIQINRAKGNEGRMMTSAEIVTTKSEYRGQIYAPSEIVMQFAETETSGAHTAPVRLGADVNLSIGDIVFVQN